jgi:hypothetical protein
VWIINQWKIPVPSQVRGELPPNILDLRRSLKMLSFRWIRGAAVTLATLGTTIPAAPAIAGESISPARPAVSKVNAQVFDIALSSGGTFKGRVVDHTGAPMEGAEVVVTQDKKEIAKSLTDKTGSFAVSNLKTGAYTVSSGNTEGSYRLWAENTAPPSAKEQGLLVMGENGARGNFGFVDGAGVFVIGAAVIGVAGLAVGIAALVRANQVANRTPASP